MTVPEQAISMKRTTIVRLAGGLATLVAVLAVAVPSHAALTAPVPEGPADGTSVAALPAFSWTPVAGADRYEFQLAADPGFNSPVLGFNFDRFFTRNTSATLLKAVPNGSYWWRVRAVAPDGSVSSWSGGMSIEKNWASAPSLLTPAEGAVFSYPTDHFRLEWTPVPGAWKYLVSVATDPSLGSLVWSGGPTETQASAFTLSKPLTPDKTYYWGITPIDVAGNRGAPSAVRSFVWTWPSATQPEVHDVADPVGIHDYEFSWDAVAGAAGYEIEINSSSDWAPGSKVCCDVNFITKVTTIGTTFTPRIVLPNNHYYWRVRAVDPSRNAGVWNVGPEFTKSFANILPSVEGLRMLDSQLPTEPGYETSTPIVSWDAVPGASAYEVEVTRFENGCQWSATLEHWKTRTATTHWTPLGSGWNGRKPYGSDIEQPFVSTDFPSLVVGHAYCVRVTALDRASDAVGAYVRSAETYLPDANNPAFVWIGPPSGAACSPDCSAGAPGSDDYLLPARGSTASAMPLFRWKPLLGAQSYFVLVAKDPDFTNIVDYAFTQLPAYAPRTGFGTRSYPDETTAYYWVVLPAADSNGDGVVTAPRFSAPAPFHKQSVPPHLVAPANGTVFEGPARFHWTPVEAARRYRLQVSRDPTFASAILEDVVTDSTAHTSLKTFDADVDLYWRVRADDENLHGLTWSDAGSFRKTLAGPVVDPANASRGDALPTWQWFSVPRAVSYDIEVQFPNGLNQLFVNLPSAAFTPTEMKGTGIWHWRARANFPQADQAAVTHGPWTPTSAFARTIREPANPVEHAAGGRLVFRWDPKIGARNYRVQVSTRPDFSMLVETTATENAVYAPLLGQPAYAAGGTFYWRVAAADDVFANIGDYTATRSFVLPPPGTASRTATTTTASVTKTKASIRVRGIVSPAHAGKRVTVTLSRKRDGAFATIATKRPFLSAGSGYAARFTRPRSGACRVVSRFPGDADHRASARSISFSC
jgi:hypothetical protein